MKSCALCPRMCRVNRSERYGFCGCGDRLKIARAALHFWEEPCISGRGGSGAVFFSGCNLRCCFCQNYNISSEGFGKEITVERLSDIFLELQEKGAENINLVTPTHYVPFIIKALDMVKHKLNIPVVYNCGGYENVGTIKSLDGYIDIYMPDIKYYSDVYAKKYSKADKYFEYASSAVKVMTEQTGKIVLDGNGIMKRGVIIRHMVMPGCRKDSMNIIKWIGNNLDRESFIVSLMSQYTPAFHSDEHKEINRKITTFEYESVAEYCLELGLDNGYVQERTSAEKEYTPPFDLEGVERTD